MHIAVTDTDYKLYILTMTEEELVAIHDALDYLDASNQSDPHTRLLAEVIWSVIATADLPEVND